MAKRFRVTYATLSADNEDLQAAYEEGVRVARSWLGETLPGYVSGQPRTGGPIFEVVSPADRSVMCRVHEATPADIRGCGRRRGSRRRRLGRRRRGRNGSRSCERRRTRSVTVPANSAALMAMEVGKNRLEALGDVEEIGRPHPLLLPPDGGARRLRDADGPAVRARGHVDVMRPYGVWAVITPFNFPMALAGGPAGAALVAGNTVVLKPLEQGVVHRADELYECLRDGGRARRRRAARA